jgi:hypothetical protein
LQERYTFVPELATLWISKRTIDLSMTVVQVLNVDGVTGGFNFQNAWTGGYIAGTSIGTLASSNMRQQQPYLQLDGS